AKAAEGTEPGEERLHAMGRAYRDLLADRTRLLVQLQSYAACDDSRVRKAVQRGWEELYSFVQRESGADTEDLRSFFAIGMLMTVTAACDLFSADSRWTERFMPGDNP